MMVSAQYPIVIYIYDKRFIIKENYIGVIEPRAEELIPPFVMWE